jgi:hypothetical protein
MNTSIERDTKRIINYRQLAGIYMNWNVAICLKSNNSVAELILPLLQKKNPVLRPGPVFGTGHRK